MKNQQTKLMSPESFFNQLKLSNITEDMKKFIMYMNQSLMQAQNLNQNLILAMTEQLLKEKETDNQGDGDPIIVADLSNERIKDLEPYELAIKMTEDGIMSFKLEDYKPVRIQP